MKRSEVLLTRDANQSFIRIQRKNFNVKKLKYYKLANIISLIMAILALIYEISLFSFQNWFTDVYLFLQVSYLTCNLGFLSLNMDSQGSWLKYRVCTIYVPFVLITVCSIVELSVFGTALYKSIEEDIDKSQNFILYTTLALLIPTLPSFF